MKKVKWTIPKIKSGFSSFYTEFGRYPTAHEVDAYSKLPSSRQIQRAYGGLVKLREMLGLKGQTDFTTGAYSSLRATRIAKRAHETERVVYNYLAREFGGVFVHREYLFLDDRRTRTDFFVHSKKGNFSIDVFYPKNKKTLLGCINSKMRTYSKEEMLQYPVIFLMMNPGISQKEIEEIVSNKKIKLMSNEKIMTFTELKKYCKGRGRFSVS